MVLNFWVTEPFSVGWVFPRGHENASYEKVTKPTESVKIDLSSNLRSSGLFNAYLTTICKENRVFYIRLSNLAFLWSSLSFYGIHGNGAWVFTDKSLTTTKIKEVCKTTTKTKISRYFCRQIKIKFRCKGRTKQMTLSDVESGSYSLNPTVCALSALEKLQQTMKYVWIPKYDFKVIFLVLIDQINTTFLLTN